MDSGAELSWTGKKRAADCMLSGAVNDRATSILHWSKTNIPEMSEKIPTLTVVFTKN